MRGLIKVSLLLVIVLVSLSAYLRLAHSGIGCIDWPACYGRIGVPGAEQLNESAAWATPLHRLVASVLGALVLVLTFLAFRESRHRAAALGLLGLTVFLAVLGVWSGGLHNPAVVMGNLAGGFGMLALLGWMTFDPEPATPGGGKRSVPGGLVTLAIVFLAIQILLGGLTSANFAATACRTLPDCHGGWLPDASLMTALDLTRQHEVTSMGQAVGGAERIAIHRAHRLGAAVSLALALAAGALALRAGGRIRTAGIVILVLVTFEFGVGVAAVITSLPVGLAVAHNWLAALLLLGLLWLAALNRAES